MKRFFLHLKMLEHLRAILLYRNDEGERHVQGNMNNEQQRGKHKELEYMNGYHVIEIISTLLGCRKGDQ